jgi:hypothetical protein
MWQPESSLYCGLKFVIGDAGWRSDTLCRKMQFMSIGMPSTDLSPEQVQLLAQIAEQKADPWPQILNYALSTLHLKPANGDQAETVGNRMRRLGLLGCITDGPEDLSTNSQYMEGFGTGGH